MRTTVKFPALMPALPARHKNPKLAVCAFDTVVDIPEIASEDFPVAISVSGRRKRAEYRYSGGQLYVPVHADIDTFLRRHSENVLDIRAGNRTTRSIMREIARTALKVDGVPQDVFWPKDAHVLLGSGMNSEWAVFKELVAGSAGLQLDGSWRTGLGNDKHLSAFVGEAADVRLARYEEATRRVFSSLAIVDGQVWVRSPEPCYVASMAPEAWGHEFDIAHVDDVGPYAPTMDNLEDSSWWHSLRNKGFSLADRAYVESALKEDYSPLPDVEILIPEAISCDIGALELDRCARVVCKEFADRLNMSANGDRNSFRLPTTDSVAAWVELRTLVASYDPLSGVPDEVEDSLEKLINAVSACEGDEFLIRAYDRAHLQKHLERWREREVTFDLSAPTRGYAP